MGADASEFPVSRFCQEDQTLFRSDRQSAGIRERCPADAPCGGQSSPIGREGDRVEFRGLTIMRFKESAGLSIPHTKAAISRDGRFIAWLESADESDIWMATFQGAEAEAR